MTYMYGQKHDLLLNLQEPNVGRVEGLVKSSYCGWRETLILDLIVMIMCIDYNFLPDVNKTHLTIYPNIHY